MEPTHIVLTYPSQNTEVLFRACDGMMIGERQGCTVIYGENPNAPATDPKRKQSRVFLDGGERDGHKWNDFASRFLREVVTRNDLPNLWADGFQRDSDTINPVIEERCQEGSVILAPDSLDLRTNGGGMPAVGMRKLN